MPLSQNNFHCNSSLPTPNPNTPSACLYPLLALLHRGPGCCCCCVISLQQIVAINYFQQPLFITSCGPTPNCPHPSLALLPWDPTSLISLGPLHMCCAESLVEVYIMAMGQTRSSLNPLHHRLHVRPPIAAACMRWHCVFGS